MVCICMHNECICMCEGLCLNKTKQKTKNMLYFNNLVESQTHIFPKKTIPTPKIVSTNCWKGAVIPFPEPQSPLMGD